MKRRGLIVLLVVVGAMVAWAIGLGGLAWYGAAVLTLLSVKALLSWLHRPKRRAPGTPLPENFRVGVAIPMYNEDPEIISASLDSILRQTRLPQSVTVVDDGSSDTRALEAVRSWAPLFRDRGVELIVIAAKENKGKRHGLITCLDAQPDTDLMLCVDSDTVLAVDALEQALIPFSDDTVQVVTGLVLALNHRKNLLTRLTDVRYTNAFLFERAAYSSLNSVLCACGSLAVYRTELMQKYRDDFLGQTFLGKPAVFGDDRRMTNYGLLEGKALLQESAVAETAVPERWGHYARQQIRWNKSFFRESLWVVRHMSMRKWAFWLTAIELLSWFVFSVAIVTAIIVAPILFGPGILVSYAICTALLSYIRAARYIDLSKHRRKRDRAIGFALSPLYGAMYIILLVWLRAYALATLSSGTWGTRSKVEVELSGTPPVIREDVLVGAI